MDHDLERDHAGHHLPRRDADVLWTRVLNTVIRTITRSILCITLSNQCAMTPEL